MGRVEIRLLNEAPPRTLVYDRDGDLVHETHIATLRRGAVFVTQQRRVLDVGTRLGEERVHHAAEYIRCHGNSRVHDPQQIVLGAAEGFHQVVDLGVDADLGAV